VALISDRWNDLYRFRQNDDIPSIVRLLADPDVARRRRLRSYVLSSLAYSNDPVSTSALINAYENDTSAKNRLLAIAFLARRTGAPDAALEGVFLGALEADDGRIRIHAARGLAYASSERAAKALVIALRDPDTTVRLTAADSLGWVGISRPEVASALVEAAEDDRSWRVRQKASQSLGRIDVDSTTPPAPEES
jgi:HEAT repeat protein